MSKSISKRRVVQGKAQAEMVAEVPIHVKAVKAWDSASGEAIGYFAGIFGPNGYGFYGFLCPAMSGVNAARLRAHDCYPSEKEALAAWFAGPVVTLGAQHVGLGVAEPVLKRINALNLFRAPNPETQPLHVRTVAQLQAEKALAQP